MDIVVLGATGVLGRHVADALEKRGHTVARASRRGPTAIDVRSDLAPCADADVIVHCAADPFGAARAVEVDVWSHLRAVARHARFVYPSIVGCDRIAFPYYHVKTAAEKAVAKTGDHAIVRLTQFHEFVDRLARMRPPMVPAAMRTQPIAAVEAAAAIADAAEGSAMGRWPDVGGPEVHRMAALIRQRMRADGRRGPILRVPVGYRGFRAGHTLCPDRRVGHITWAQHLAATS